MATIEDLSALADCARAVLENCDLKDQLGRTHPVSIYGDRVAVLVSGQNSPYKTTDMCEAAFAEAGIPMTGVEFMVLGSREHRKTCGVIFLAPTHGLSEGSPS